MVKFLVFFNSMFFTIGIIGGIGPQNTNLISHAIHRNHQYWVSIASLTEVAVTLFGCFGIERETSKLFFILLNLAGALFLIYYLFGKLKSLSKSKQCNVSKQSMTKRKAMLNALALIWLNPLVYVDSLILIGGASASYYGLQHILFIVGCICGYAVWKLGVPFAVSRYSDNLNRPSVWKALDIATIIMVSYVLIKLINTLLHYIPLHHVL